MTILAVLLAAVALAIPQDVFAQASLQEPSQSDPFARYNTPDECVQHALQLEAKFWRDKRPDTVFRAPLGNPYRPHVVESARKCVGRFAIASVAEEDLITLGEAYLAAGQFAQADSAFKRLITAQANHPVQERARTLSQIVSAYLARARPARPANAIAYMKQLEALGVSAAVERLMALREIIAIAEMDDNVELLQVYAPAAVKAASEMVGDTRKQRAHDEVGARIALSNLYARRLMVDSAVATVNRGITELVPVRPLVQHTLKSYLNLYKTLGTQAPAVQASRWYNNAPGAVYPAPGKPTLIFVGSHGCYEACYPSYAPLRRLKEKYDDSGLQVVIASTMWGFFQNQLATPEEEMEKLRWYFGDFLDLKYPLSVWQPETSKRDDGVIERTDPPHIKDYYPAMGALPGYAVPVVLVDKQGRVRTILKLTPLTERRLDNLIAEVLK